MNDKIDKHAMNQQNCHNTVPDDNGFGLFADIFKSACIV